MNTVNIATVPQQATDGINDGIELRKQRGLAIAALAIIEKKGRSNYFVPSQSAPRRTTYKVQYHKEHPTCTCPDFETRGCRCKHVFAVEFYIRREHRLSGEELVEASINIKQVRKTYSQDWPNYNAAQVNEKRHFQELLHELCSTIPEPKWKPRRGRPKFPLADAVFSIIFRVYGTRSGRRFSCDLDDAKQQGYISSAPHYNTAFRFLESEELYPVLLDLIERTSLPLKSVESQFAVDSTGFAYSRFVRWYDIKYNRFSSEQQWIKAHICTGTKTNIITSIEIHGRDSGDALHLPALVEKTAENFDVKEVSADKGYSGRECHDAIAKVGATPYIAFKDNATGGVGGVFEKMFHFFQFKREEFLAHYHRRSNVESTVSMVKAKFGDSVRSKSEVAARNEVLAKVVAHNLCCLVSAIYELGIEPTFFGELA
jgi:transposase